MTRPALRLRLPSDSALLGMVRDVAQRVAEAVGFEEGTARNIALAVDEAVTNAIEHAYGGRPDHEVEVRFMDDGETLRVEVADRGATLDPKSLPEVDLRRYAREGRTGGLGVHLMERIMDSVTFTRNRGRNLCCLVKHKGRIHATNGD